VRDDRLPALPIVHNRGMITGPYRTLDEVVSGFSALEEQFRQRGDRRAIFLSLYGVVSDEMRRQLETGGFADPEWVHRYAVAFANLYRTALVAYEDGRTEEVPKPWRVCFDAARRGDGLVLQDMFLGVNAHVNNDLPLALMAISIEPDRQARYRDHAAVNAVLGSVTQRATDRIAALYAPGLTGMDDCAGELDELLSLFSLNIARESAWESAVALANAKTRVEYALTSRLISARASVLARALLSPSCNPRLMATCRRLEAGVHWSRLLHAR
jgi:hypothetical protein